MDINNTIHLWDLWTAVNTLKVKNRGVIPDYIIERNISDWLKGLDSQLDLALKLVD